MQRSIAGNIGRFYAFRVCFNARFYYPVFAVLFLDFGLTMEQFALLNTLWALTIVVFEVPSGAFADALGRVALLRLSAVLMVVEMLLILLAPLDRPAVVFWMLLLNRVISGIAEAMASGADEAMAYDSLVYTGDEARWPNVLERVIRYRSLGFMVAMIVGGFLYDAALIQRMLEVLGLAVTVERSVLLKLPVVATLLLALGACVVTYGMVEPPMEPDGAGETSTSSGFVAAWKLMLAAGCRACRDPIIFTVILAGLLHDSIVRLVLTLNSEYYRLLGISEKFYGILGALMATMGLVFPILGRQLVKRVSMATSFGLAAVVTFVSLLGIAFLRTTIGVAFVILMMAGFVLLNYFVSFYLNRAADSRQRATLLSFKGLAYNLGYGGIGLVYAGYCHWLEANGVPGQTEAVFSQALRAFPAWFAATMVLLAVVAVVRVRRGKPQGA